MALTLLVVDDHPSVRRLLELIVDLDLRFSLCRTASTGPAALQQAFDHQPDVIVLDADLDGHDGLALIGSLRAAAPDTAIAVFSSAAYASEDIAERAGADMFIPKGTDLDELLDVLAALVPGEQDSPATIIDLCDRSHSRHA